MKTGKIDRGQRDPISTEREVAKGFPILYIEDEREEKTTTAIIEP